MVENNDSISCSREVTRHHVVEEHLEGPLLSLLERAELSVCLGSRAFSLEGLSFRFKAGLGFRANFSCFLCLGGGGGGRGGSGFLFTHPCRKRLRGFGGFRVYRFRV